MTVLMMSMCIANPTIVIAFLCAGANPHETDKGGYDALMAASMYGRVDNIDVWLTKNPEWNMERRSKSTGATALASAVYLGRNKLETVKRLVAQGAKTSNLTYPGATLLMLACGNEDSDPKVVRYLLERGDVELN